MASKLPVIGSTASTTAFCSERVDGPGGLFLYMDGNGKVTAGNGTLAAPKPNAFSLRNIDDCPGRTPTCSTACYVENLRGAQPALYALYEHNAATIRIILADPALAADWVMRFAGWITLHAKGGFRWHVSGDVFSFEYAAFIADVCRESPTVDHWIYTRSFHCVPILAEVSTVHGGNLALNLSCDVDNYDVAKSVAAEQGGRWMRGQVTKPLRLCYLTVDGSVPADLPDGSVIFPDYQIRPRQFPTLAESPWWQTLAPTQRAMVCPVDGHGKSEGRRCGPCSRCLT